MVVEIDPTCCNSGSEKECEERKEYFLGEVERFVAIWAFGAVVLSRGVVSQEEEEGKGSSEVSEELGVGGGHPIAFAVHLYAQKFSLATHTILLYASQSFYRGCVRFGRSSFISRFRRKLSASQPNCPPNMRRISISRVDQISVT